MKDTVFLSYGSDGIKNMTKTKPRKNTQYVKVTVDIPQPPEVVVTVPQVSPSVEVTNHVEPDWVNGEIWCNAHGTSHPEVPDYFEDDTEECVPDNWQRIAREPTSQGSLL